MFEINTIVKPLPTADSEYSVCGNSVLRKAKVVDTYPRKENGNNIKIEILEHVNPDKVGKIYHVDDRFFEAVEAEWIWIDAYKATDANGCCLGYQYDIDGEVNEYDGTLVLGCKGFHVAVNLEHTFKNYPYDFRNRYWRVRALVNAKEYRYRNPNNTTLVAKAVAFMDDITEDYETIDTYREYINS